MTFTVDDAITFFATVPRHWKVQLYIVAGDKNIRLPYQKTVKEFLADELFKTLCRRECKTAVYEFEKEAVRIYVRKGTPKQARVIGEALGVKNGVSE